MIACTKKQGSLAATTLNYRLNRYASPTRCPSYRVSSTLLPFKPRLAPVTLDPTPTKVEKVSDLRELYDFSRERWTDLQGHLHASGICEGKETERARKPECETWTFDEQGRKIEIATPV